jgi:hypothetical protein
MTRAWLGRTLVVWVATTGLFLCGERAAAQPVLLESAALGATGSYSGSSVATSQFVGWRFQIDTPLAVEQVGGHLLGSAEGGIFAALVSLDTIDAIPHGLPFTDYEVIATTVFQPPLPSEEVAVPLTAELRPGSYALVFGTGYFGASGEGALPNFDDQPDIPPTDISSFIFWSRPFFNEPFEWRENLASHMRFVVAGEVLQIPGDFNLDGDVNEEDFELWRDEFGASDDPEVDGNHNGTVDAADYTVWRDNVGASVGGGGGGARSSAEVPEPTSALLLLAAAVVYVWHGCGRRICIYSAVDT